jgi:DNA-binding MarR family transcriptional regulator
VDARTVEPVIGAMRDLVRLARGRQSVADGLSTPIAGLLGAIASEGPTRSGRLAQVLGVDVSVVSRSIAKAQEQGLVDRRADPSDGRACELSLTQAGLDRLGRHRAAVARRLTAIVSHWDDDEIELLGRLLSRLAVDLRAATDGSPASAPKIFRGSAAPCRPADPDRTEGRFVVPRPGFDSPPLSQECS